MVGNEEYEGALLEPSISGDATAIKGPACSSRGEAEEQRDQVSGKRGAPRGCGAGGHPGGLGTPTSPRGHPPLLGDTAGWWAARRGLPLAAGEHPVKMEQLSEG